MFVDLATREEDVDRSMWSDEVVQVYQALLSAGAKHRSGYQPPLDATGKGASSIGSGQLEQSPPPAISRRRQAPRSSNRSPPDSVARLAKRRKPAASSPDIGKSVGVSSASEQSRLAVSSPLDNVCSTSAAGKLSHAGTLSDGSTSSLSDVDLVGLSLPSQRQIQGARVTTSQPVPVLSSETESMDSDDCSSSLTLPSRDPFSSVNTLPTPPLRSRPIASVGTCTVNHPTVTQPTRLRGIDISSDSDSDSDGSRIPARRHSSQARLSRRPPPRQASSPAALVNEEDCVNVPGNDDWLIDDIGINQPAVRHHRRPARSHGSHAAGQNHARRQLTRHRSRSDVSLNSQDSSHDPDLDVDLPEPVPMEIASVCSQENISIVDVASQQPSSSQPSGPLRLRVSGMFTGLTWHAWQFLLQREV